MTIGVSGGDEFRCGIGLGAAVGAGERDVQVDEPGDAEVGELDERGGGRCVEEDVWCGEVLVTKREQSKLKRGRTFEFDVAVDQTDTVHSRDGAAELGSDPADGGFGKGRPGSVSERRSTPVRWRRMSV